MKKELECECCGNSTFKITEISDCSDCEYNGAYTNDERIELIFEENVIKSLNIARDQVEYSQECCIGTAFGAGCSLLECTECGTQTNLAMIND